MTVPTRPLIGITTDLVPAVKQSAAFLRLATGYADCVYAAGGLPILLPPMTKDLDRDLYLDKLDGVVLCGGADLDPRRSNLPTHPAVVPMPERRETSDRLLVQRIIDRQVPVLGVGVGMQLLNTALGGSLWLHLPEDMPKAMPHFDASGGPHRHIVLLEPNTTLDEIYGGGEIRVNSSHHQAVRDLGEGLRVGALSPDGVIEGIESTDADWFCIGVQWHPESETASALDMQLFERFLEGCGLSAKPLQLAA